MFTLLNMKRAFHFILLIVFLSACGSQSKSTSVGCDTSKQGGLRVPPGSVVAGGCDHRLGGLFGPKHRTTRGAGRGAGHHGQPEAVLHRRCRHVVACRRLADARHR